jgi:hypothetical protein
MKRIDPLKTKRRVRMEEAEAAAKIEAKIVAKKVTKKSD